MNKRLFISHASEDKHPFVRALAECLRLKGIDVWYDEYEIKPGMSIRESIDSGLSSCDVGLVILSASFFKKKWTTWELNGIIQKMMSGDAKLIPIQHNMNHEELVHISPPLSDILALNSVEGMEAICQQIYDLLYPDKPVLVETREILNSYGLASPDYFDNWWLDRIEFLGNSDVSLIPWSFPINPLNGNKVTRSSALSWSCMRYTWITMAEKQQMNQFAEPQGVVDFIKEMPGLNYAYKSNLNYLALYAPQLFFLDSPIKEEIEQAYRDSVIDISKTIFPISFKCELTIDENPPTCNRLFALLDKDFGRYRPVEFLRHFIEGEKFGPRPSNLDYWDVLIRLCSEKGRIYPAPIVNALLEGYRSNYSALQLKKIFIDKSPKFLAKVFSKIDLMQRTIEEIIEDRRLEVLTSATEIADKICNLNLSEEDFEDRMYRLTIPTEEMDYHYRGITQVGL